MAKECAMRKDGHPSITSIREAEDEETRTEPGLTPDHPQEETKCEISDTSTGGPSTEDTAGASGGQSYHQGRWSPVPSVMSMKSDQSIILPPAFTEKSNTSVCLDQSDSLSQSSSSQCSSTPLDTYSSSPHAMPGEVICRPTACPKKAYKSCPTCMASFCEVHVVPHYTDPALRIHRLVEAIGDLCQPQQIREFDFMTDVPPPGPIEFSSVKPDNVCVSWGPPEGLIAPHKFRVSWMGVGCSEQLKVPGLGITVQELRPGEEYTFTVATLQDNRQSPCVSATMHTDVPPPESVTVKMDLPSALVSWSKPAGVDQASYMLTLSTGGDYLQTLSIRSLQHSFKELAIGREYITSVSTVLNRRQSEPVSRSIQTNIPVPEKVTVGSVTPTSADLSWSLQQGMQQIPHRFLISYCCGGAEPQIISTALCCISLKDMQPNTQYTISVCCELDNGEKSEAASSKIKTGDFVPEGLIVDALNEETSNVPEEFAAYVYNGSDARWMAVVRWRQLQGLQHIPHRFLICCSSEGIEQKTISTESCSITLQGLQSNTQYKVTVRCELQDGKKSRMATITFHTSERRIVLLGKTGDGKSSAGNSILGEEVFTVGSCQHGVTNQCISHSKVINGRKYTVIDTPGFFDPGIPEDSLIPEIAKCIFDSAPGPHAFVIVLRVGRYTDHEQQTMEKIRHVFADDAFKHAVVLFTHGEDLDGKTIEEFVRDVKGAQRMGTSLQDLVEKCHDNYHVIDNKHWNQEEGRKSKKTQVASLLKTIDQIVEYNRADGADYYTNEILVLVELAIRNEMHEIRQAEQNQQQQQQLTDSDIRERAKKTVVQRIMVNKHVAAVVMLLGFVNLPAIPSKEVRKTITTVSTTAKNRAQAIVDALQKLHDLLPNLSYFGGGYGQYQKMD